MENLYIKLLNNRPVDHPFTEENMITSYPEVDLDNLPLSWAKFVRVPQPRLGVYERAEVHYEWDGDVVSDTWHIYPMGPEEKLQKQNQIKQSWATDGYSNWIFDEETCTHKPPVPYPTDGKKYIWVQEAEVWVQSKITEPLPDIQPVPYPTDGKVYDFDLDKNCWVLKL